MRKTTCPPRLLACAQPSAKVRAWPRCNRPVGLGARRPRGEVGGAPVGSREASFIGAAARRRSAASEEPPAWTGRNLETSSGAPFVSGANAAR